MSADPLPRLHGEQRRASAPEAHVWLSASAGTGKTQVLAARVYRLLLRGVDPSAILCLTFTKAGAAEMAGRINRRLAAWVRLRDTELTIDLEALGETTSAMLRERARTLFAKVLDAPGGGLRIQTIHGFCQSLLAAFPVEAGLVPGFRPIEPREESLLQRQVLADMLVEAERDGRAGPVRTIGALSLRLGEGQAEAFLRDCARAGDALEALPVDVRPFIRHALDLSTGDVEAAIHEACGDDAIDRASIETIATLNRDWGTKTGVQRAESIGLWLAAGQERRAATLHELHLAWAKGDGEPQSFGKGRAPPDSSYANLAMRMHGHCADLLALRVRAAYADLLADALAVGRNYARAYAAAKRRAGLVDFDDLIKATGALLAQPGIGAWVRYKLDSDTEHVLIDEAQDTNAEQWAILRSLVEEYFTGQGVHAPSTRTLFTVGDHKQAIFGFQGTDPIFFDAAERHFAERAAAARGDDSMPDADRGLPFERLSLTASFRSTEPVLAFIDAAIGELGADGLGAIGRIEAHASRVPGPGAAELWPPAVAGEDATNDTGAEDRGEEDWIDDVVRENASRIARQVRRWLDEGLMLGSKGRALRPEDVMILVRRRGDLARLLVARLYAEGVPVAGVDRLLLNAPLAVQDLLAAVRFVLQPGDDLSLASLLVSPLIGWSQDELMTAAMSREGGLWRYLRRTVPERLAPLEAMLARADFATPYQFLEELLSGALDGRRKLLHRLGAEARDPIEELLSAALDFEATATPSLQRFLDWFDRGEVEIKRDSEAALDAVRVLTVHGAKGLQAPVVILADATGDPATTPRSAVRWTPDDRTGSLPVFRPREEERAGAIDRALGELEDREREEHWRLFYVAATRAEERLVFSGSLGARAKDGKPPEASWYALAARTMAALGAAETGVFTGARPLKSVKAGKVCARPREVAVLPDWARQPAPVETRPPRPLAPSSLGEDRVADPPPSLAMRAAAERGRLIHALFERLPAVAAAERRGAADGWLRRSGGVADASVRAGIVAAVMAVLDDPAYAELFGPDSLGEAPISAVIEGGVVVAGTVDRLLVTDERIAVVDFKTGRVAPDGLAGVPSWHLRQMAAYAAALAAIFPDRAVTAALLYTAGPTLIALPPALLAAHKPGFAAPEQSLTDAA